MARTEDEQRVDSSQQRCRLIHSLPAAVRARGLLDGKTPGEGGAFSDEADLVAAGGQGGGGECSCVVGVGPATPQIFAG